MPTYDLRCDSCSHRDEYVLRIAERNNQSCPDCGASLRQVIAAVPIVGAREDRPVILGNGHYVATTETQVREYEQRTGHSTVSTSSTEWKNHVNGIKENATKYVEKMGYSSVEDFRANHGAKVDAGEA